MFNALSDFMPCQHRIRDRSFAMADEQAVVELLFLKGCMSQKDSMVFMKILIFK